MSCSRELEFQRYEVLDVEALCRDPPYRDHDRESFRQAHIGKLQACRYFFRYELPKCHTQADLLMRLDDICLSRESQDRYAGLFAVC